MAPADNFIHYHHFNPSDIADMRRVLLEMLRLAEGPAAITVELDGARPLYFFESGGISGENHSIYQLMQGFEEIFENVPDGSITVDPHNGKTLVIHKGTVVRLSHPARAALRLLGEYPERRATAKELDISLHIVGSLIDRGLITETGYGDRGQMTYRITTKGMRVYATVAV